MDTTIVVLVTGVVCALAGAAAARAVGLAREAALREELGALRAAAGVDERVLDVVRSASGQALHEQSEHLLRVAEHRYQLLERSAEQRWRAQGDSLLGRLGEHAAHLRELEAQRERESAVLRHAVEELRRSNVELRDEARGLVAALSDNKVRGTWGEVQLRRVLEHAGMLEHCDFDEQVSAVTRHDARVRPDAVVHLPGGKSLVVDSKAPLTAFLRAQGEDVPPEEAGRLLRDHARALRRHVESLAAKDYWSAFDSSPEMVVCFVPSDAVLAAALRAEPGLYDQAQSRRVVLASPGTLLAVLRATALAWQQEALTANAQQLLRLGGELHQRLGTVGRHLGAMGSALRRSVETYNHLVGTLEARVLVTSRRMHDLGLVEEPVAEQQPLEATPRPLTSLELLSDELREATPRRAELDTGPLRWTEDDQDGEPEGRGAATGA